MLKFFSLLATGLLAASAAFAAPMLANGTTPVIDTGSAGNRNSVSTFQETDTTTEDTPGTSGAVPEPATMALLGIGIALAGFARRKK